MLASNRRVVRGRGEFCRRLGLATIMLFVSHPPSKLGHRPTAPSLKQLRTRGAVDASVCVWGRGGGGEQGGGCAAGARAKQRPSSRTHSPGSTRRCPYRSCRCPCLSTLRSTCSPARPGSPRACPWQPPPRSRPAAAPRRARSAARPSPPRPSTLRHCLQSTRSLFHRRPWCAGRHPRGSAAASSPRPCTRPPASRPRQSPPATTSRTRSQRFCPRPRWRLWVSRRRRTRAQRAPRWARAPSLLR